MNLEIYAGLRTIQSHFRALIKSYHGSGEQAWGTYFVLTSIFLGIIDIAIGNVTSSTPFS